MKESSRRRWVDRGLPVLVVLGMAVLAGVVVAKTFDQFLTPILSRLIFVVPNLSALDVSNTVAAGFAVGTHTLIDHILLGLGYALPMTAAAYFILKNREVAA